MTVGQPRRASVAALVTLGYSVAFAACASGGAPTPVPATPAETSAATASASPAPLVTAPPVGGTPSALPATPAAPSPAPIQSPIATEQFPTQEPDQTFHGAVDLEALIPDEVGDITLDDPMSFSGQEYFDAATGGVPQNVEAFNDFLARLGRSINDLSGAAASGFSDSSDDYVYVTANRVAGADGNLLFSETVQLNLQMIPEFNSGMRGTATPVTLAGKNTTKIVATLGEMVYDTSYYYGYGDTIFKISANTEEVVAEALSLLP